MGRSQIYGVSGTNTTISYGKLKSRKLYEIGVPARRRHFILSISLILFSLDSYCLFLRSSICDTVHLQEVNFL